MNPNVTYKHAIVPVVLLIVVGTVIGWLQQPFAMQAMMASMPPDRAARMGDMANSPIFLIGVVVSGVVRIIGVALWAGGAHLALLAMYEKPVFRRVFVGAAWAQLCFLLRDGVRLAILMYHGLDSVKRPEDMAPGIGLGFLVENPRSLAYDLFELLNVYDLAFVWVFAGLLVATESVKPGKAITAVMLPWLLLTILAIGAKAIFFYN